MFRVCLSDCVERALPIVRQACQEVKRTMAMQTQLPVQTWRAHLDGRSIRPGHLRRLQPIVFASYGCVFYLGAFCQ
jgi:hypothetical protein